MAEEFGDFIEAAPRFIVGVDGKIPLVQATFTHSVKASEITASVEGGLAAETAARQSADTALQTNIDSEASARASADTTLQNNLNTEAAARASADTSLQTNVTSKINARIAADTNLQTSIDNEATARAARDAQLLPLAGGTMIGPLLLDADPLVQLGAATKDYVDSEAAKLQDAIDIVSQNLVFSGQLDVPADMVAFTSASGLPTGPLPVASAGLIGRYVIVTTGGASPVGSNIPAGNYVHGDWLVCDSYPSWYWLKLGSPDVVASDVGVLPAINGLTDAQSVLEYLDASDNVSADAGNLAELGTDGLVMVPNTSVLMGVTDGSEALPGQIGEYKVTSNTVGVPMTSDIATQICSLSLSPGDWEIWGSVDYLPPSNVSPNMIAASVSVHPDALPNEDDLMTGVGILNMFTTTALTSGQRQVLMTGQCRSNSAAPIDLYLVAQTVYTGQGPMTAKGYICARRVR